MKNIPNSFNEIIINKTLASQHHNVETTTNTQFDSLLNNEVKEIEEITEIQKESSSTKTIPQIELENLSYLNKIFLSFI